LKAKDVYLKTMKFVWLKLALGGAIFLFAFLTMFLFIWLGSLGGGSGIVMALTIWMILVGAVYGLVQRYIAKKPDRTGKDYGKRALSDDKCLFCSGPFGERCGEPASKRAAEGGGFAGQNPGCFPYRLLCTDVCPYCAELY